MPIAGSAASYIPRAPSCRSTRGHRIASGSRAPLLGRQLYHILMREEEEGNHITLGSQPGCTGARASVCLTRLFCTMTCSVQQNCLTTTRATPACSQGMNEDAHAHHSFKLLPRQHCGAAAGVAPLMVMCVASFLLPGQAQYWVDLFIPFRVLRLCQCPRAVLGFSQTHNSTGCQLLCKPQWHMLSILLTCIKSLPLNKD